MEPAFPALTRREFLAGLAAAAAAPWAAACARPSPIKGSIIGAGSAVGHLLRGAELPKFSSERSVGVFIAGAGISGLSAAWKLRRSGVEDFEVVDLEDAPGGNSRWGENEVSAYPWAAHYLPFPGREAKAVHELLRELKVETGRDAQGRPVYDARYVCHAPEERLFIHGRWREGIFPKSGATVEDLRQTAEFEAEMERWRRRRGKDGKKAFAIPMELSSQDAEFLALDQMSMAGFLELKGWTSPRLRWFVDYACRDDFGASSSDVSAWAGVHYFAAREADGEVLTWPEGNGFLARKLCEGLGGRLKTGKLVLSVAEEAGGARIDVLDAASRTVERVHAKAALICLPRFSAARIVESLRLSGPPADFHYAPWVVANLTIDEPPEGNGYPISWDNVIYESESLGFVSATHQSLAMDRRRGVWTYYLPLCKGDYKKTRMEMLDTPWSTWRDRIIQDLARAAPGLAEKCRRIDVMLWGHGMIRPSVGFLWGKARREAAKARGAIFFGHSDLSGFSIFEEAQYRGVKAAEDAMKSLGKSFVSSL